MLRKFGWRKNFTASFQVEAGDLDTKGEASISSIGDNDFSTSGGCGLGDATYDIDVNADGGGNQQLQVALLGADTWAQVATKIQVDLRTATSGSETVTVEDGKLVFRSGTDGDGSTMVVAEGSAGGTGLLDSIDGLSGYTTQVDEPVDGRHGQVVLVVDESASVDNPSKDLMYTFQVLDSDGKDKTAGISSSWDQDLGSLIVGDDEDTTEIATDDVITIRGCYI